MHTLSHRRTTVSTDYVQHNRARLQKMMHFREIM